MPTILDVFHGDAFNVTNLTDALNNLKYVPGRIGELGIFSASGVTTTSIAIEQKSGVLILVPPTPRGGPGVTMDKAKRNIRNLSIPHFEINDGIMAEEVQGVRAFGEATAVETVQGKVAERGGEASQSFAATSELAMVGAIKGLVTYADASTLDLFTAFGVAPIGEIDMDLDNIAPVDGILRKGAAALVRMIAAELDGIVWNGEPYAICGDNFFDALLQHKEVRDTYKGWTEAQILRDGYISPSGKAWGAFRFGGVIWDNYRGGVGGVPFIDPAKCYIFPMGVPGLFRTYWAPADYIETVNTPGQRLYGKIYDMPNGKGVHMDTQMNELSICTRPRVLLRGKMT